MKIYIREEPRHCWPYLTPEGLFTLKSLEDAQSLDPWFTSYFNNCQLFTESETDAVEKEREKAEKINGNLRRQLQDYIVPEVRIHLLRKFLRNSRPDSILDCLIKTAISNNAFQVIDYVQVRADLYELTKTLKTWERKVDIAQVKSRRWDMSGGWIEDR